MEKLSRGIIRFRWLIIVIVLALTVFLGYQIKFVKINSDVINSLPESDPYASLLKQIGEKFGGNKMGMVILETDNIYRTDVLEHVKQMTDTLQFLDGISTVTSLTNIIDIKSGEDGLEVGKLVDEYDLPDTQDELDKLRERVLEKEMYRGAIVSEDGTATVILFTLLEDANVVLVARAVKEKTVAMAIPETLYYAGSPMMVTSISDMIKADLYKLIPISLLVIAFILLLSFRSLKGVILPILTAVIAIIWTIGSMALGGFEMSIISNNIPILLLAVGTAYSIHVLNRINEVREQDGSRVLVIALTHVLVPVLLAALTTVIGFLSFIFGSYLTMIRDFGIFTALGTFFSVALSIFFVPAVLSGFAIPVEKRNRKNKNNRNSYMVEYLLLPLKNLLFRHPKYILTGWAVVIFVSIGGIFLIKRSVNIQDYFKKDNPARVADYLMEKKFGGSKPVFVLFEGDMQDPEVLQTMIRAENYMKKSPDIMTTQSVADLIVELSDGFGEGRQIPDDRDKIEQMWFMIDGNEIMSRFVNEDLTEGIIISKFISPENKAKKEFSKYMQKFIRENSTEKCRISLTGMPFIDVIMSNSLLRSQIGSLVIAILFVIVIVGLILRSFFRGIYASMPIIASTIFLFGIMGFTGIPLNIATVLVASVTVGIGIDYSIHVISNFHYWMKNGEEIQEALKDTILVSGKAIIINVVSVTVGFLVLLLSEMVPLQYFGLLIGISMVISGLAALTLLPVILIIMNKIRFLNKY
jgi:predicted RND superfamily exporter protein